MSEVHCFKGGFSKSFKRRIQSLEFDSRQVSAELPVDLCLMLIAFSLPSLDLLLQGFTIWNPAIQALCTKNREFTFGPIEPTSMLGCVMELQLAGDPACFGGCKGLVERGRGMRIEIQSCPICRSLI